MSSEEINTIASLILSKIEEKYFLISKKFDLSNKKQDIQESVFVASAVQCVSHYFNVDIDTLIKGKGKVKPNQQYTTAQMRGIVCALCRELPNKPIPFQNIGDMLNGKNHATLVWTYKRHLGFMEVDKKYRQDYDKIEETLNKIIEL